MQDPNFYTDLNHFLKNNYVKNYKKIDNIYTLDKFFGVVLNSDGKQLDEYEVLIKRNSTDYGISNFDHNVVTNLNQFSENQSDKIETVTLESKKTAEIKEEDDYENFSENNSTILNLKNRFLAFTSASPSNTKKSKPKNPNSTSATEESTTKEFSKMEYLESMKSPSTLSEVEEEEPTILETEKREIRNITDSMVSGFAGYTFTKKLMYYMDLGDESEFEICERAGVDNKFFSEIKLNENYKPKKSLVFAFAIALRLTILDTENLLELSGFDFSDNELNDLIIKYCILNRIYDVMTVNDALYLYEQKVMGSL